MSSPIRVRFAPSPTGFLHVGGLRTALYNYLFARHNGGSFVLRIEDTDQARRIEGAVENLIGTLKWAGINYDEGPDKDGGFGPYVQSERLRLYKEHAEALVADGKAYYCFCTQERLKEVREKQLARKAAPGYDRHCRNIPAGEAEKRRAAGEPHVVRMKLPESGEMSFDDLIRGAVTFAFNVLDDQVILKSDGFPTYHLAVVVDDHFMKISHVIRGEEWLPSTPKHITLFRFFGWEVPKYAHLPLLLNPDKSKLSKRQGDVAVEDYREKGYLKEAIVNFVAFLGWNPGDERELFTLEELVKEFTLERVGKSGAVFNIEKLTWLNSQHLRSKSDAEVLSMLERELIKAGIDARSFREDYLLKVISAMRERVSFAREFVEKGPYFFHEPVGYEEAVVKKRWTADSSRHLAALRDEFSRLDNPSKEDFEAALHRTADGLGISPKDLIHPLRLALSGAGAGPGLYDIVEILGKDETVRRITTAVEILK